MTSEAQGQGVFALDANNPAQHRAASDPGGTHTTIVPLDLWCKNF